MPTDQLHNNNALPYCGKIRQPVFLWMMMVIHAPCRFNFFGDLVIINHFLWIAHFAFYVAFSFHPFDAFFGCRWYRWWLIKAYTYITFIKFHERLTFKIALWSLPKKWILYIKRICFNQIESKEPPFIYTVQMYCLYTKISEVLSYTLHWNKMRTNATRCHIWTYSSIHIRMMIWHAWYGEICVKMFDGPLEQPFLWRRTFYAIDFCEWN